MKYAIYEDLVTHKFVLIHLPDKFVEGDKVPSLPDDRWFDSLEEAVAVLPQLLDMEG